MRAYFFSRRSMRRVTMFCAAVVVVNLLAFRFLAAADMDEVSLDAVSGRTVVIDAGHGGIDSGARYHNLLEKDITLALSLKLGELLKAHGATVVYTREGDVDYYTKGKGGKRNDLLTRIDMINQSQADVFVSIHCNAVKESRWTGSQIFYNPKLEDNKKIAEMMQSRLRDFPPNNRRQAKRDEKILVLNSAQIPGVLVEAGYLSNSKEAALLSDAAYQSRFVEQLGKSLASYVHEAKGGSEGGEQ